MTDIGVFFLVIAIPAIIIMGIAVMLQRLGVMRSKTILEIAEIRIDKMGFTDAQKGIIFYDWPEGDGHIEWLLTATEKEIINWVESMEPVKQEQE